MKDFTSTNSLSSPATTLLLLFLHKKKKGWCIKKCPKKYMKCCWLIHLVVSVTIPQMQRDTNSKKNNGNNS